MRRKRKPEPKQKRFDVNVSMHLLSKADTFWNEKLITGTMAVIAEDVGSAREAAEAIIRERFAFSIDDAEEYKE